MDVVRTCCKLSRIHHAFTVLSLRPHYVHTTSTLRPWRSNHDHTTLLVRSYKVLEDCTAFLLRPCGSLHVLTPSAAGFYYVLPLIESFNHFQIKTFLQLALLSLFPLLFFFDPFLILVLYHSAYSCCKNKILPRHEKTGFLQLRKQKRRLAAQ